MPILNSIVGWLNIKRLHQIELFKKYPFEVQQDVLLKLLEKAKDTEWGIRYRFADIQKTEMFRARLPVVNYEILSPIVQRIMQGEQNILWPTPIKWFAKSSGTTNDKSKFIPVSKEALEDCHYRGGKDILAIYTNLYPESKIFAGKGLTLGGSHQISSINNQAYYGDLSAILIQNLPFWVDFMKTPRQEIALMAEWEQKLDKLAEETFNENVTSISGVPSWMLVLIKHMLNKTGKDNLLDIWPNLELFVHGGVSFGPYREQYRKLIPIKEMHYMETYNASEGFFAVQDDPSESGMLLMLDLGIYYEFIPMEEIESEHPRVLHVGEVETGRNYAIVISTNSGLWRYMIGDTVQFTSLYPHKIKITGRTRHFMNVFGEEIIVDNAEKALRTACEKTQAIIAEYTAGPVYMDTTKKGRHEWLIEFEKEPASLELFASLLDKALMAVNSDYEAKRYKSITLEKPLVRSLKKGVFYRWLQEKHKLGGQNKVPRLFNERKYIDELSRIQDEMIS
jgi:hypothetical protein